MTPAVKIETSLYQIFTVPFESATNFCRDYLGNGDLFIPVGGGLSYGDPNPDDRDEKFMKEYDKNLVQIYQRQENNLTLQNPKYLGCPDHPEAKGYSDILERVADGIDFARTHLPKGVFNKICEFLFSLYRDHVKTVDGIPTTYIWIPLWNPNAEYATMMVILDKIVLLTT